MKKLILFSLIFTLFLANSSVAADGGTLYAKSCQACHNTDGTGKANFAKMMKVPESNLNIVDDTLEKPDSELIKVVLEGSGKMKAVSNVTAHDAGEIIKYIRSLKK